MNETQINMLPDRALKSLIATMNPDGHYAPQVRWAKAELIRRGVDYSDCIEPVA